MITIFKFKAFFNNYPDEIVERCVAANTQEEAIEKFEKMSDELVANGFVRLISCGDPTVEIENVII